MIDYTRLLEFTNSDRQHEILSARIDGGSAKRAAEIVGCSRQAVEACIRRVQDNARRRLYSPEHGLHHPVPENFTGDFTLQRNGDGEIERTWMKGKADAQKKQELYEAVIKGLASEIKPAKPVKPNHKKYSKDLANAIIIGDAHIGMIAHALETNDEDANLETVTADLRAGIDYLVDCSPASEQGWFVNLGDFTHCDSTANTTTGGTKQDVAARQFETMEAAGQLMRYAVTKMLTKFKQVTVINARGNHDNDTAFALNMYMQAVYENEPRVEVQGNRSKFHFLEFGKCLIGINHGDKINVPRLVGTMTKLQAEAWGRTTFRRWWIGHIHHKDKKETDFGVTVESFNTLVPLESWHADSGYGAERRITMITLHREYGEVFRMEPSIEMVRAIAQ